MKRKRSTLLMGLLASALLQSLGADEQTAKPDLARLQGEWSMVGGNLGGYPLPDATLKNSRRVCKGAETTVTVGGTLLLKANFTLHPSTEPKSIDYQVTDGPNKGKAQLGIYELDGDRVKFCFAAPGKTRSTGF